MDPSYQEVVDSFSTYYRCTVMSKSFTEPLSQPSQDYPTPGVGHTADVYSYVVPLPSLTSDPFKVSKRIVHLNNEAEIDQKGFGNIETSEKMESKR